VRLHYKDQRLMLSNGKRIAVYSENPTKRINSQCGQSAFFLLYFKAGGMYSYHLKGLNYIAYDVIASRQGVPLT
jgi:hypothetical protein